MSDAERLEATLKEPATVVGVRLCYNLSGREYSLFLELSAGEQQCQLEFADISRFYLNGLSTGMTVDLQFDNGNGIFLCKSKDGRLDLACRSITFN